jgi:hypothetical protein
MCVCMYVCTYVRVTMGVTAYSPIFLMNAAFVHNLPFVWHGKIIKCMILLLRRSIPVVWMEGKF